MFQPSTGMCKALYDLPGETSTDLAFKAGDCITLLEHIDDQWCRGELHGKQGKSVSYWMLSWLTMMQQAAMTWS